MAENGFPETVEDIVATLVDFYRHQGESDIVELLESASARIEETDFDNWNGGTYTYELMLEIPVSIFARVQTRLEAIEKGISEKLAIICRNLGNDHLSSATITPLMSKSTSLGPSAKPTDGEVTHIWKEGLFRLFLSHVSAHKVAVAALKRSLRLHAISAFVAHEDITPSLEWQDEIELALCSMDAIAALITPDFHASHWTDQEVGFALGKGVLVVPVRLGADPYGMIGKVQGLSASLSEPAHVASLLANTLLTHVTTRSQMRKAIISAFAGAESYVNAIALSKYIASMKDFTTIEKESINRGCQVNGQVYNAIGVVSRVCTAIGLPKPTPSR